MIPDMTEYIDIGVNLTSSSFNDDRDDVIQRALDAGISQMVVTGTDIHHSRAALALNRSYPGKLVSTAGLHPHHASDFDSSTISALRNLCANESVVAVGECGLDYNRQYSRPDEQRRAFEAQLLLACELKLPVFLHQRDAHEDFVSMINEHSADLAGAVAHCFTGSLDEAMQYIALDLHIGITGWICDERRGGDLRRAVGEIPVEKIMLETDAPYLLPRDLKTVPVQKRRNEPCYLPHICRLTAQYMGLDSQRLAQLALENTRRFFRI